MEKKISGFDIPVEYKRRYARHAEDKKKIKTLERISHSGAPFNLVFLRKLSRKVLESFLSFSERCFLDRLLRQLSPNFLFWCCFTRWVKGNKKPGRLSPTGFPPLKGFIVENIYYEKI